MQTNVSVVIVLEAGISLRTHKHFPSALYLTLRGTGTTEREMSARGQHRDGVGRSRLCSGSKHIHHPSKMHTNRIAVTNRVLQCFRVIGHELVIVTARKQIGTKVQGMAEWQTVHDHNVHMLIRSKHARTVGVGELRCTYIKSERCSRSSWGVVESYSLNSGIQLCDSTWV